MLPAACSKDYWPATLIHTQSSRACFIQFKALFSRQRNDWSFLFQSYKIQDCTTLIWAWSNKMVLKQWIWNPINCLSLSRLNTNITFQINLILSVFDCLFSVVFFEVIGFRWFSKKDRSWNPSYLMDDGWYVYTLEAIQ